MRLKMGARSSSLLSRPAPLHSSSIEALSYPSSSSEGLKGWVPPTVASETSDCLIAFPCLLSGRFATRRKRICYARDSEGQPRRADPLFRPSARAADTSSSLFPRDYPH
ncbi:hypothetical protein MRX96_047772 [Rhipicephalus microplus]